jgi:hypothetical protein
MKLTKEIIAHHEAGHLVAQLYQGLKVRSATIVQNGDVAGCVDGERHSRAFRAAVESSVSTNMEPRHKDRFEKEARSLLAGLVAQRRFAPRSVRKWQTRIGHRGDMPEAEELLHLVVTSDREFKAYFDLLKVQTGDLIERRWRYVEAVAAALCERETLSRKEIVAIIGKTGELKVAEVRSQAERGNI